VHQAADDLDAALAALGAQAERVGLIYEEFVPFDYEVSIIGARGTRRDRRLSVERQRALSRASSRVTCARRHGPTLAHRRAARTGRRARTFRLRRACSQHRVLRAPNGRLLANETAPRVHNSGHWTIEGAETSQFENHLRAVLGLPLGSIDARGRSCMLNWIGEMPDRRAVLAEAAGHWHDYGKSPREGRKVGHATLIANGLEALADALDRIGKALDRRAQVAPPIARLRGR
jgi:5-(carboxyamino)imidazole ribonucleotide synthase